MKMDQAKLLVEMHLALQAQVSDCVTGFEDRIPERQRDEMFSSVMAMLVVGFYRDDLEDFIEICRRLDEFAEPIEVMTQ